MKTKKILAVALITIGFLSVSCVDNAVSPLVEAIRTQQVEWMKAKTASEVALAAVQTALADYQKAQTANQISQTATAAALAAENLKQLAAINALTLISQAEKDRATAALNAQNEKTAQMAYDIAKAKNDVTYAQYQTQLATEKVNLANATAALAAATVTANNTNATNYYNSYVAASNNVVALTTTKMQYAKQIADDNAAIAYATTGSTISTEQLANNKKSYQNTLAAQQASLAYLNATATDPVSIQTQIDNLNKLNAKYQVSIDSCTLVITNKDNDIAAKNAAYFAAGTTVTTYLNLKSTWTTQQTDSTTKEATLVTITKSIATYATTLAADNITAATQLGIYNDAKANSDAKQATYDALKTSSDAAYVTYTKANAALTLATTNLAADPTNAALITAKANATTAVTNATTAYNAAIALTNSANINLNNALNITNPAKTASDNAASIVKIDQANLTSAQTSLVAQQQSLADVKTNIKVTRDKLVAMAADYQKAITTSATLYNTYKAAQDDKLKTQAVQSAKASLISANTSVISTLNTAKTNATAIQTQIETLQTNIGNTKTIIANIDEQLATIDITTLAGLTKSKTDLTNDIAQLTLATTALDIEIANQNKIATYWKGLLDKLFV
jgi:hypothetical protein